MDSGQDDGESGENPPSAANAAYSLSRYYPKNVTYFYGFPAGENSNFFNLVSPWKEELVSARPLTCAGGNMKVITFSASVNPEIWQLMTEELRIPLIDRSRIITFPAEINAGLNEDERNKEIRSALMEMVKNETFVMAQPYMNEGLNSRYLIDSEVAISLNDKVNRPLYTPEKYLPEKYQLFASGAEFVQDQTTPPLPCVVKVSSSSAGDGVRICHTKEDFEKAKVDFAPLKVRILTEKFIKSIYNLGIQFGISQDGKKIEIIGYNEQLIDAEGGYLGGAIDPSKKIPVVDKINRILQEEILPNVQKLKWFGVGGIDILVDKKEDIFVIDPNFRMTASTSYLFASKNGALRRPLISFVGEFKGSREDFMKKIVPISKNNSENALLRIIALTKRSDSYGINGGILFDNYKNLKKAAKHLKDLGIEGGALDRIINSKA